MAESATRFSIKKPCLVPRYDPLETTEKVKDKIDLIIIQRPVYTNVANQYDPLAIVSILDEYYSCNFLSVDCTQYHAEIALSLSMRGSQRTFARRRLNAQEKLMRHTLSYLHDFDSPEWREYKSLFLKVMGNVIRPQPRTLGLKQGPKELVNDYWERARNLILSVDCSLFNVTEDVFNGFRPELREGVHRRIGKFWKEDEDAKKYLIDKVKEAAAIVEMSLTPDHCSIHAFQPRTEMDIFDSDNEENS
ncbi:uncharacterized protein V2V93DRAFT_109057 [Kockiozyma suomiensis]|uniref:uncharacterized protein n=1 Tax=Kockiozyma suomiensis TaxID=1337062 RepID=UPI00334390D7